MAEMQRSIAKLANVAEMLTLKTRVEEAAQAAADRSAEEAAHARLMVLAPAVEAAYLVAVADGAVSDVERSAIVNGICQAIDSTVSVEEIDGIYDTVVGLVNDEGKEARLAQLAQNVTDPALRDAVHLVACAVAWKDGGIGQKQGLSVRALATTFGFSEHHHQSLLGRAR